MTLDAGGTNLVFSAVRGGEEIVERIGLSARRDNLESFLQTIIDGFKKVQSKLSQKPVAISFCFPGPAEYEEGIIGDLENLSFFRGGVALGPMLEDIFQIPVFINNDGDLFAYGEAVAGLLPEVNALLAKDGSPKRYQNLFGATFGTGFGGGIVHRGELFLQRLVDEMNTQYTTMEGTSLNRLEVKAFNLEINYELMQFIKGDTREITVPFSDRKIKYDSLKRVGVGITRLGTANAVAIGAYAFALNQLDR